MRTTSLVVVQMRARCALATAGASGWRTAAPPEVPMAREVEATGGAGSCCTRVLMTA